MKALTFLISLSLFCSLAFGQQLPYSPEGNCATDSSVPSLVEPLLRTVKQAGQRIPAGQGQCGVISNTDDYWFCLALEQRNCGLIRTTSEYWKCEALIQKNCGLAQGKDFWFCQSLVNRSCGLNRNNNDMWMCKGILESNCGLNPKTKDFWFCEGVKGPLNEILSPKERKQKKVDPYII